MKNYSGNDLQYYLKKDKTKNALTLKTKIPPKNTKKAPNIRKRTTKITIRSLVILFVIFGVLVVMFGFFFVTFGVFFVFFRRKNGGNFGILFRGFLFLVSAFLI
jgi:uncharacterized membrane protein